MKSVGLVKHTKAKIHDIRLLVWLLILANLHGWKPHLHRSYSSTEKDSANWSNMQLQPKHNNDDNGGGAPLPDGISWTEDGC